MVRSFRSNRRSPRQPFSFLTGVLFGTTATTLACGSRGPLDDDARITPLLDASLQADGSPDQAVPAADAGAEGGSVIACGTCLVTQCARGVVRCVQDAKCRATLQCVATDCLAAGSAPSPGCLFKCASGDAEGALAIVDVVQCVTGTCGTDCNPVVSGGLGGLGGLAEVVRAEDLISRPTTPRPVPLDDRFPRRD